MSETFFLSLRHPSVAGRFAVPERLHDALERQSCALAHGAMGSQWASSIGPVQYWGRDCNVVPPLPGVFVGLRIVHKTLYLFYKEYK